MEAAIIAQTVGQAAGSMVVPGIEGGKGMFDCLKRKYGYVKNIKKNFGQLKKEEECLCDEEDRVVTEVNKHEPRMKSTRRYQTWLNDVKEMKEKIRLLEIKYEKISQCLCGLCPIHRLLKHGRRIVELTEEVVSLKKQIGEITIMVEKPPDSFIKRHATNIEGVPSLYTLVKMVQGYLEDEKLKKIRIWGPAGVGKTTIMENVYNAVGESGKFNMIFWIPEKADGNIMNIQEIILEQLKRNVEEHSSNHQRAEIISTALEDKRYVLFLDGVSSEIDLKEIGVHDEHAGRKIVFTCRYKDCWGETNEDVKVQGLSYEDAENLFWEKAGVDLKNKRDIKPVAERIIVACCGMPHVIKLMGTGLKDVEKPAVWRARLEGLRSPTTGKSKVLEPYYNSFQLIHDSLEPYMRTCLLYWAIFPIGCELDEDYIFECWRAQQFLKSEKLDVARDSGHDILDTFVKKYLLLNEQKRSNYKMFEYFHRAAIARCKETGNTIFVQESARISEKEWKSANGLSLVRFCPSTLPERPKCGSLLTLLLQKSNLSEFPGSFFEHMSCLQLLDLQHTDIKLLPPSISSLINLKALFLNNCFQLSLLPPEIGDLNELEILDIRHTGIHCLPSEIGKLTNFKCLKISFVENVGNHNNVGCIPGEMIASNIISKLLSLEELIIDVPDLTSSRWKQNVESIAREVAVLEQLTTLHFYFPIVKCFQTFFNRSKSWNRNNALSEGNSFRSFNVHVGCQQRSSLTVFDVSRCSAVKHLRFSADVGIPNEVSTILGQACSFELIGHQEAASLSDFGSDKLGGLEACIIEYCNSMTSIIDGNRTGGVAFQNLNELHIKKLPRLVHIWEGFIGSESLKYLTSLTMKECHRVKALFSQEVVSQLNKLQYLQVEDCGLIEEIIEPGSAIDSRAFPALKILELTDLPKLSAICNNVSLEWSSLEEITIRTCGVLTSFPYAFQNVTKLRVIVCSQTWFDGLDWQNYTNLKGNLQRIHKPI